jgi:polar amino acid transport system substrate-binding protein
MEFEMKQITQNYKTGELRIEEVPFPLIRKGGVLVRNHFSIISTGTEKSTIQVSQKGYIGKAKEKPDLAKQVINTVKVQGFKKTYDLVMNKLNTPIPLGYSSSGTIIEVGEDSYEFQVGDRVACAGGGYANHAEVIFVPKNLCVKLPPEVRFEQAAFTTLGSIALQGLRQADVRIGEIVGVIGLGLIGLLTVQLLKAAGCLVIGVDINSYALENGKKSGADYTIDSHLSEVNSLVQSITHKNGVDAVIITAATRSSELIELAGEISRKKGKVIVLGNVGMNIPRSVYYLKELDLKLSCSYGPGRYDPTYEEYGLDYPFAYVRWTEKRNMEAFVQMIKEKKIDTGKIVTHRFRFENAQQAYDLITSKKEKFVGVLLEYDSQQEPKPIIEVEEVELNKVDQIKIALIGAGNFAQSTILPSLKKYKNIDLVAVLVAESHLAKNVAEKFGIKKCVSDPSSIFSNKNINSVIISTRHNLHAHYVIEGLRNNKNVYVEKPLAVKENELKEIIQVRNLTKKDVFVGFNRRFASFIKKCKEYFATRETPIFINYRINAGFVPAEHWIQSNKEGGGRIIGEVCHFVDLCQFVCNSKYKSVFAQNISDDNLRDNVAITIKFDDGSIGNVNYISKGDKKYSKERIEIFCENSVVVIDDFKRLEVYRAGKHKIYKGVQDKGHSKQVELWLESLEKSKSIPVPFIESVNSTIATFMIHESLNKERVIYFDEYSQRFFE